MTILGLDVGSSVDKELGDVSVTIPTGDSQGSLFGEKIEGISFNVSKDCKLLSSFFPMG